MTYDALFQPLLTLVVEERDGEHVVKDAELDLGDSFLNVWRNDPETGGNAEEIIPDGGDYDSHPTGKAACDYLDGFVAGSPVADRAKTAAVLRALAALAGEAAAFPQPTLEEVGTHTPLDESYGVEGYIGVRAVATISIPMDDGASILHEVRTPGVWGVDENSDPDYIRAIADDELLTLRAMLDGLGILAALGISRDDVTVTERLCAAGCGATLMEDEPDGPCFECSEKTDVTVNS